MELRFIVWDVKKRFWVSKSVCGILFVFAGLGKSFAEIIYRLRVSKSVCGNFLA